MNRFVKTEETAAYIPVKNYAWHSRFLRRDIVETPANRLGSVHFMGATRPRHGRGRPFLDYIYIFICKHVYTDYIFNYTYVTVINMGQ